LLRFRSSKSDGNWVSLENYVDNMADDQKYIYYITGESQDAVESSPFMEQLRKRDLEVLYLVDPLDEYVTQSLTEFDGVQLMSITKDGLKFGDEDEDRASKIEEMYKPFTDWLNELYGDKVEAVKVSNRLADSPCVLVTGQYGWSANMERIMKAQTFADNSKNSYMKARKTMEINPRHPIIVELKNRHESGEDEEANKDLAGLLFDAALVQSGFMVEEAKPFATRIHRVVALGLSVDPDAPLADEIEVPEDEDDEDDEDEDAEETEDLDEEAEEEAEEQDAAEHDEL